MKQILRSEKGQSLPAVLALLVLGGLTIAPGLSYTATSLNSSRILHEGVTGTYAADAGVENVLWALRNGTPLPTQLLENINQMAVTMQTQEQGTYTLYLGELIEPGGHSDYLGISGEMVWDAVAEAYKYTITIIWQAASGDDEPIHLQEVGARLPLGYSYQSGSAAGFVENLSTDEPDEIVDAIGASMLNWVLPPPLPQVSENYTTQTQIFYVTGEGEQENHYAWVVANRQDVGAVGEITGASYRITATASRPGDGKTAAKVVADVMITGEKTYILSWQISN